MNIKNISIVLTVLLVFIAAMVLMQKGNYVDQATEHYNKTTEASFKGGKKILEYVNNSVDVNKLVWAMACEAIQTVKTSQDMAKLESKYFPTTKGSNSIAQKAQSAISKKDFIAKAYISLKESRETLYWLQLLYNTRYIAKNQFDSIYSDADELRRLLTSITKTAQQNEGIEK